jgi:hypothetical protein
VHVARQVLCHDGDRGGEGGGEEICRREAAHAGSAGVSARAGYRPSRVPATTRSVPDDDNIALRGGHGVGRLSLVNRDVMTEVEPASGGSDQELDEQRKTRATLVQPSLAG